MTLLLVMSLQVNGLRSTAPRSFTSTISASSQGAVKSKARMKANRVMAFCTGKGARILRLQRGGSKRLHRSGYTNLTPITSPFFQVTLQSLPGDVRSNFS